MNSKFKYNVSVIVPCYKVEKYISRCIDSLLNQTLKNIEIICVNDGSPDNTLEILKKYKEKFGENFSIIDKKNEGVWKARVDGINIAKGEYIAIVDSDDYVETNYLERLYNEIKKQKADIVICGFSRIDNETGHVFSKEMNTFENKDIYTSKNPEDIISINGALWNKLYRADIIKKAKLFEKPPIVFEDMMMFSLIFMNVKKISFVNDCLYNYMVRKDSAISTIAKEQQKMSEDSMVILRKIYEENNKELVPVIDALAFLHFGISLMFRLSYNPSINMKNELKKNKEYLDSNFLTWKKNKYLSFIYCLKHGGKNIKVAIMKKIYDFNMFGIFLKFYKFMIEKLKIDIKW